MLFYAYLYSFPIRIFFDILFLINNYTIFIPIFYLIFILKISTFAFRLKKSENLCSVFAPFCIIYMNDSKDRYLLMNENELIAGCVKGDGIARKQLYERYAGKMMSVCLRYIGDRETARDLLHDGFIRLFGKINTFKGDGSFEGWVRKLFVNTALEHLRKKHEAVGNYEESFAVAQEVDYSAVEKMSADELMEKIGNLPDGFRMVFNLYAIEGYSHQDIAELLNITESTSRSQYARARSCLQEMIKGRK